MSCLLFFCPSGRSVPISVLLAARSLSSYERLSSRSIRQSRTHDGKRKCTADLHLASSTDANGFHARTWLPARRPIPSARVRSIAALVGELRFRRRAPISSTARWEGRCCNASVVWLRPIDPGYFFNPLGEGTLPWVFRRGTGNPPNRVQTPLKQAPEGRGETTKPGAAWGEVPPA